MSASSTVSTLSCYRDLLTQRNQQTYQTLAKILALTFWSTLTRHICKTTFWFVDKHTRAWHRHVENKNTTTVKKAGPPLVWLLRHTTGVQPNRRCVSLSTTYYDGRTLITRRHSSIVVKCRSRTASRNDTYSLKVTAGWRVLFLRATRVGLSVVLSVCPPVGPSHKIVRLISNKDQNVHRSVQVKVQVNDVKRPKSFFGPNCVIYLLQLQITILYFWGQVCFALDLLVNLVYFMHSFSVWWFYWYDRKCTAAVKLVALYYMLGRLYENCHISKMKFKTYDLDPIFL